MKENLTEIVCILDRSGSMRNLSKDTVEGYNSFIEKQKNEPGEAVLTTVLFNDEYQLLHDRKNIKDVSEMTINDYYPIGCTSLLDAIGKTIDDIGVKLAETKEEERPSKVIFMITTDGMENSSKKYSYDDIKTKVKHQQEKYSWEFIFIGANIDSYNEGSKLGFSESNISNYTADSIGTKSVYDAVYRTIADYRKNGEIESNWKSEIV